MRLATVVLSAVSLGVALWGCGQSEPDDRDEPVRIVHAVLPRDNPPSTRQDAALAALFQWVKSATDVDAAALVVVGDFGAGAGAPAQNSAAADAGTSAQGGSTGGTGTATQGGGGGGAGTPAPAADAAAKAKRFISILEKEPLGIPVYVVPGAVELAAAEEPAAALANWRSVIAEIQKSLQGRSAATQVIDLASCYEEDAAKRGGGSCVAALPGSDIRLIGYPGFYGSATAKGLGDVQNRWAREFRSAMDAQAVGSTTILIAPLATPIDRHWISPDTRTGWMQAAGNAQIALGIEGTADLRRAAYETHTVWKAPGLVGQWLLTPPLAFPESAGDEPAQGVSVISVSPRGTPSRDVFWYAARVPAFSGDLESAQEPDDVSLVRSVWEWITHPIYWLWRLDGSRLDRLPKAAVFFIAMLAAFLTSVAVWQIPPPKLAGTQPGAGGTTPQPGAAGAAPTIANTALLDQNFARTVVSGLGGLAIATLMLDTFSMDGQNGQKALSQQFYVVWFIVWFFVLLILSSGSKSLAEGLRVISYVGRPVSEKGYAPRWRWFYLTSTDAFFNLIQGRNELKSMLWASEIRTAQLDALLAIDHICEHLRTAVVDYLNRDIDKESERALAGSGPEEPAPPGAPVEPAPPTAPTEPAPPTAPTEPAPPTAPTEPSEPTAPTEPAQPTAPTEPAQPTAPTEPAQPATSRVSPKETPAAAPSPRRRIEMSDVRVAVSVRSDSKDRVYYVSWPPESSSKIFDQKTMAYVTIAAGVTRWWRVGYDTKDPAIVLFDNSGGDVAELEKKALNLRDFFPNRGRDYSSFVMIPIPLRPSEDGRRAGLHISFKSADGVEKIWPAMVGGEPAADPYASAGDLFDTTPPELKRLLRQSINVIESLLRHFNEDVFVNALQSRRRH